MNRCGGVGRVTANPRRAPTMSANCASMNVAAVSKSGASEIAERSSARRSPLSCGLIATAGVSRLDSFKSPFQICIFYPHPVELVCTAGAELAWAGTGRGETHRFGVFEIRVDRCDDDARLDRHNVDPDQGDAHPRVDDNTLIENAIENIDKRATARGTFNGHVVTPVVFLSRRVVWTVGWRRPSRGCSSVGLSPPSPSRSVPPCQWNRSGGGSES